MEHKNLERYLNSFGKQVVAQAKEELQKEKGDTALSGSIRYELTKEFTAKFFMASYGKFLDKGVSGTEQKRSFTNQDGQKEKSPFKYTTKQPPTGIIDKWVVRKGLKGSRDKEGRFIKRKSMVFLIARSIKRKGIKGLSFFQKPFGFAMKDFDVLFGKALKKDIEEAWSKVEAKLN
tara:strand:- start:4135 stop:4662 length:528 start_codon:yes stop_codon:yes gene_type:complete